MSGLMLIRDIGIHDIDQLIFIFITSVACFYYSFKDLLLISAFLIPLTCGLNGYIVSVLLLSLFFKGGIKSYGQVLPLLVFAFLEISQFLDHDDYTLQSVILYLSNLGLFFYLLFEERIAPLSRDFIRLLLYGISFILFLILVKLLIFHGDFSALFLDNARATVSMGRFEDTSVAQTVVALNANSIGYFSILAVSILLFSANYLKITRTEYFLILFANILFGAVTLGRTWLISLILLIILYFFTLKLSDKLSFISILVLIIFFVILVPALYEIFDVIFNSFSERFMEDSLQTGSGRTRLFEIYNTLWMSDPNYMFFGIGANYRHLFPYLNAMHNATQQIYVSTGLLGASIYIIYIIKKIRIQAKINKFASKILYIPLFIVLIYMQSIPLLENFLLLMPLVGCFIILNFKSNEIKE